MIRNCALVGVILLHIQFLYSQCLSGDCNNGNGKYSFKSGAVYTGQFNGGRINGIGNLLYTNGDRYTGEWLNGRRHGEGKLTKSDGTVYQGHFNMNAFHGFGILVFRDGTSFESFWKEGRQIGIGKLKKNDGTIELGRITAEGFVEKDKEMQSHLAGLEAEDIGSDLQGDGASGPKIDVSIQQEGEGRQSWSEGSGGYQVPQPTGGASGPVEIHALIVGVSRYVHFPTLKYTDDDAYRVYAFLKSPEGGAVPDKNIRMLIDEAASRENILDGLHHVVRNADPNDAVFVYISGHGLNGAYLPFDSDGYSGFINYSELRDILNQTRARQTLCLADACHSGSMLAEKATLGESLEQFYQQMGRSKGGKAFMLSSRAEEYSLESQGLRQGIFSHYLIKGLAGNADTNRDKIITISELYAYIRASVTKYTGGIQTPLLAGNFDEHMPVGLLR